MLQQRQRSVVRQNEVEQSNINMTSIHYKLQEEAEKIRKWQTSSEIELKQKMAKLKECELLLSKQRNQVLQMQIENETLSAQLQKELMNQAQINMKLKTSRELFVALKNHSENLQTSVLRGEEDRDSLRMLAADNIKQIQEMKTKMQEIVQANEKRITVLKSGIKDKELALEDLKFISKNEIDIAKKTNEDLEKDLAKCKADIDDVSRQLLQKRNHIVTLEEKIKKLEDEKSKQEDIVASKVSALNELQIIVDEANSACKAAQEDITKLQQENQSCIDQFNSNKSDAENQIEELQSELTELTDSLTELSTQYNEMTSKHDRLESENKSLKASVSQLVKCVEELQEKQEQNEQEMSNLNELCKLAKENESELRIILEKKGAGIQELSSAKNEIEAQFKSISDDFNKLKSKEVEYLDEIEQLSLSNSKQAKEVEELKKKSFQFDSHSKSIASDLNKKSEEFSKLEARCNNFEGQCKSMTSSLSGKEVELKELISKNDSLKRQVSDFVLKIQVLEEEHTSLNGTVSSLQKNFDRCYIELSSMRVKVQDQENLLSRKDSTLLKLEQELESSFQTIGGLSETNKQLKQHLSEVSIEKDQADKLSEDKSSECNDLGKKNTKLQTKINQLQTDLKESKSLLDSAVNGSSDLQKTLSKQLSEANASLADRDSLIEKMTENLSNLQKKHSLELNNRSQKEAFEKENRLLKTSITNKDADISALAEEIAKLQNKIIKLDGATKTTSLAASEQLNSLNLKIANLERDNAELSLHVSDLESRGKLNESNKLNFEIALDEKEKEIIGLESKNKKLESKNSMISLEVQELKTKLDEILIEHSDYKKVTEKLKEKEAQLKSIKTTVEDVRSDFLLSEKSYLSTIEKLKEEIKKMTKSKVNAVLSNVTANSPAVSSATRSPFSSPIKQSRPANPESPKTPLVNRSKKRRVAFGKSPSWHATSDDDDEEADTTVSSSTTTANPSKVKFLSLSKSPKSVTYSSAKSPARLKLTSSKSPGSGPVSDLLAKYPAPSAAQKRGIKLPDAYVKRKEANEKKKQKIKVESCSWFDSDSAFGFDEC